MMKCEICGKQIKGANRLKVHKERAHQNESLRTCHICQQVLYNRCELYKHYINIIQFLYKFLNFPSKTILQSVSCLRNHQTSKTDTI